jgi:hypothetical protein
LFERTIPVAFLISVARWSQNLRAQCSKERLGSPHSKAP